MPFENLNETHYTPEEIVTINTLWVQLEEAFAGKTRNLSPEERQEKGSINDRNKRIVHKALDYRNNDHRPT